MLASGRPHADEAAHTERPLPTARPGHNFANLRVHAPARASRGKLLEDDTVEGTNAPPTAPAPDAGLNPPSPEPATDGAKIPTLALSGVGSYKDNGESHEKITYNVTVPSGANAKDYCLVQWTKGYAKNGDGTYFKSTDYGKSRDWNYADWIIDSVDPDPIYWSKDKSRWNYNLSGDKFTATDDPGPALSSEKGAVYAAQFKVAVYETAKVPTTTSGTISTTALTAFEYWNYSVHVKDDGTFTHPKI